MVDEGDYLINVTNELEAHARENLESVLRECGFQQVVEFGPGVRVLRAEDAGLTLYSGNDLSGELWGQGTVYRLVFELTFEPPDFYQHQIIATDFAGQVEGCIALIWRGATEQRRRSTGGVNSFGLTAVRDCNLRDSPLALSNAIRHELKVLLGASITDDCFNGVAKSIRRLLAAPSAAALAPAPA